MGKVEKIDSGANGEFVFSQITPLYTFSVKKCLDFLGSVHSLWAVSESTITEIAKYIQKEEKHKIKLNDIRGDNILNRAYKYYEHILKFPLFFFAKSGLIEH
jgi:hypothetical protein